MGAAASTEQSSDTAVLEPPSPSFAASPSSSSAPLGHGQKSLHASRLRDASRSLGRAVGELGRAEASDARGSLGSVARAFEVGGAGGAGGAVAAGSGWSDGAIAAVKKSEPVTAAQSVWQVPWAEEDVKHRAVKRSWRAISARYAELEAAWGVQDPSNETWVSAQHQYGVAQTHWEEECARRRGVKRRWQEESGEPELVQQLDLHARVKAAWHGGAITAEQWEAHRKFHRTAKKNWLRMAAAAVRWEQAQQQHAEVAGLWAAHTARRQKAERILAKERGAWLAAQDATVEMRRGRVEEVARAATQETMRGLENKLRADCRAFEAAVLALPLAKKVLLGRDPEDATYQVLQWGMDGILAPPGLRGNNLSDDDDDDDDSDDDDGSALARTAASSSGPSWRPGVDAEPSAPQQQQQQHAGAQTESAAPSQSLASTREANVLTMLSTTRQLVPASPARRFDARGDLDELPDEENPMLGAHSPFHRLRLPGAQGGEKKKALPGERTREDASARALFRTAQLPGQAEEPDESWATAKHERALARSGRLVQDSVGDWASNAEQTFQLSAKVASKLGRTVHADALAVGSGLGGAINGLHRLFDAAEALVRRLVSAQDGATAMNCFDKAGEAKARLEQVRRYVTVLKAELCDKLKRAMDAKPPLARVFSGEYFVTQREEPQEGDWWVANQVESMAKAAKRMAAAVEKLSALELEFSAKQAEMQHQEGEVHNTQVDLDQAVKEEKFRDAAMAQSALGRQESALQALRGQLLSLEAGMHRSKTLYRIAQRLVAALQACRARAQELQEYHHLDALTQARVAASQAQQTLAQLGPVVKAVKAKEEAQERLEAPFAVIDKLLPGRLRSALVQLRDDVPKQVQLNGCAVGADGARMIAEAMRVGSSVTELYLIKCEVGPTACLHLAEMLRVDDTVEELYLGHNDVLADGADHLASALLANRTLSWLYLPACKLGDGGAKALGGLVGMNDTLQVLVLDANGIGPEGACALCDALRANNTLQTLSLADNEVGAEGAERLAQVLRMSSSLVTVNLVGCDIGKSGRAAVEAAMRVNRGVTVLL